MGSWNHTCGISGLSISQGEKVVLILLSETAGRVDGNPSYISDNFTPVSIPIVAEYNDYGQFALSGTDRDHIAFDLFLAHFKKHIKADVNESKPLDIGKIDTLNDLVELMRDDNLFIEGYGHSKKEASHRSVFVFPILHTIYEQILASKVSPSWNGKPA